ncbi:hypothetical protein FSP39_003744 [Pinctada imbricata]|uniref:Fucosyltransferase n=1 Tax=Pinctada imbricata TaxID=66713 RepID=A0AA88XV89_PINIB|nr:hypothetical protein FSP39_003744 [Pinctada imbricata]
MIIYRAPIRIEIMSIIHKQSPSETKSNIQGPSHSKTVSRIQNRTSAKSEVTLTVPHKFPSKTVSKHKKSNKTIIHILYWNPPGYFLHPEDVSRRSCMVGNCELTFNKEMIKKADAVIFNAQSPTKLPKKEFGQVWVFFTLEPADYTGRQIERWERMINWTWTYRRDSDIFKPYVGFKQRKAPIQEKMLHEKLSKKMRDITWMVSHCQTTGKRELYAKNLKKFSSVDIFGACGSQGCPRFSKACDKLLETYRYYLAFENCLCRDYATEKIFNTMEYFIVPIVYGGYNSSVYFPPKSIIDTKEFPQASDLNKKLKSIASDLEEYREYYQWRDYYDIGHPYHDTWCDLCSKLHNQHKYRRLYDNIANWWKGHSSKSGQFCRTG